MNRRASGAGAGLIATLAIAISACGATNTSTVGQQTDTPRVVPAAPAGPGGATGVVAAVTASDVHVQNPRVGQVRVAFTPSTSFTKVAAATAGDLVIGTCVVAIATPQPASAPATGPSDDTGTVTASSINIRSPGPNGCGGPGRPGRGAASGNGS